MPIMVPFFAFFVSRSSLYGGRCIKACPFTSVPLSATSFPVAEKIFSLFPPFFLFSHRMKCVQVHCFSFPAAPLRWYSQHLQGVDLKFIIDTARLPLLALFVRRNLFWNSIQAYPRLFHHKALSADDIVVTPPFPLSFHRNSPLRPKFSQICPPHPNPKIAPFT